MNYGDARAQIQTGDVLLFSGTALVSRVVRWGSKSQYSHCGIAGWWEDRLLVFEAEATGLRIDRASLCVDRYRGGVDWYSPTVPVDRVKIHREALDQIGKPYGYAGLLRLSAALLLHGRAPREDGSVPVALFCSQYVSQCYRAGGVDLSMATSDQMTTPGQIARSPLLQLMGNLRAVE
jgi:cell wall-associated NlpC family hydrolase